MFRYCIKNQIVIEKFSSFKKPQGDYISQIFIKKKLEYKFLIQLYVNIWGKWENHLGSSALLH